MRGSDQVLQQLIAGNQRYVAAQRAYPDQTVERRAAVADGQQPFAVIVGCSDSRVVPEIIFDQGLGGLFVIGVAGHIVSDVVCWSIEYAADYLGVPLIVVVGHQGCAAVEASVRSGGGRPHIAGIVESIQPAVKSVKGRPEDRLTDAVKAHVRRGVGQLTYPQGCSWRNWSKKGSLGS